MTEAGFNRVVAMIQLRDFGVPVSPASEKRYRDWRASLPKTRNKKQRKAANVPRWTEEDIRKARGGASEIDAFFSFDRRNMLIPTPPQSIGSDPDDPVAGEDGTPVSFEIAEAARKGGG
jgi:hypothetical protein